VGLAPQYVVGEGKYLIKRGAKLQSDSTQVQKQQAKCGEQGEQGDRALIARKSGDTIPIKS